MSYPLYDFGGTGEIMTLMIANGFPPQTYRPMLDPLTDRYHPVCVLPRALWPDPQPHEEFTTWRQKTDDLLAAIDEHQLEGVIGVGHSMGGVATALAAIAQPERFRALILLDPTFLPPFVLERINDAREKNLMEHFPLSVGARKRRAHFESTEAAYEYWRGKPLFKGWPDASMRHYAESMTRPSSEGGVTLAWSPDWEAQYYDTIITDSWDEVPKLRGLLPTLVIRGMTTDTFVEESARRFRELVPDATLVEIPDHGHLFPQSAPDETRRIIEGWLATLP
jgi:pimeloyl-ACP methyl ester carboxylesterase